MLLSGIYLLICTKSSPLYPFNDWVDSNAFFTMGKGMMNGKVLYRDLFEQKGPLLYFIHGISYLVSNKTFLGIFIFEIFSFAIFLFYCHKLITLFLNIKYSLISLPLITSLILNMKSFSHGDSAEEFCLPLLAISLYYLIKYFVTIYPEPVSNICLLLNGIIAGCVLWIKFSLLGFWFGWMASMFFCLIINKHYLCAVKGCFIFLFGMLLSTFPWIFYFGINNSISDWLEIYIFVNVNSYSYSIPFLMRIKTTLLQVCYNLILNPIFGFLLCFGLLIFIIFKKFIKSSLNRVCLLFCYFFLTLSVYGGGQAYIYYFLILSPFVVFGFIAIMDFFCIILDKYDKVTTNKISVIIVIVSLVITFSVTIFFNHNAYMIKMDKEDLVQYKFASIINQTENATLLNYGFLDMGLYTVTGITPNIKFFEKQNIDYSKFPSNMDEQNRYIRDKEVDYVVIRQIASQSITNISIPYLYNNYELLRVDTQMFENVNYNYLLFKRIK